MLNERDNKAQEALCKGLKEGYAASKAQSGLCWWERILWALLSGLTALASFLLTSCAASISRNADGSFEAAVVIVPQGK